MVCGNFILTESANRVFLYFLNLRNLFYLTVFKLRGESFRGKKLETVSLQTGKVKAIAPMTETEE